MDWTVRDPDLVSGNDGQKFAPERVWARENDSVARKRERLDSALPLS